MNFDIKSTFSRQTVKFLMETNTLTIHPEKPFKLASGLYCPFYVNCRKLISHPEARSKVADYFTKIIEKNIGVDQVDVIAGGVTAGVPFATLVADKLQKPLVYIRRDAKDYAFHEQIEGGDVNGKRVVLIEDLITGGDSKINFAKVVREQGGEINHTLVVFSWANEKTFALLKKEKLTLHTLVDLDDLLAVVESNDSISPHALEAIRDFVKNPKSWSDKFLSTQKAST